MKTLFLLRGLPGAGKSTFANSIWQSNVVFEADKYFIDEVTGEYKFNINELHKAHEWNQHRVEEAMLQNVRSNGQYYPEIVVANTLTTEKELEPYLEMAKAYGFKIVSLIIENRHGNKSVHSVPEETLTKMRNRFVVKL
jgi:predicted kinase